MNYEYIEKLVKGAKTGDLHSKETLLQEFTPFINSISRRIFIHGYERCDIKNECFLTLCNCISKYKLNANSFVGYATNAIKNNLSDSEKHLVFFIFFKNNTLTNYAYHENISYVTASKRKKKVLEKLKTFILCKGGNELWELTI